MLRLTRRLIAESLFGSPRGLVEAVIVAVAITGPASTARAAEPRTRGQAGGNQDAAISELPPAQPAPNASRPPAEFAGREGFLALVDGRVVSGKVTPAPGGYLLKRTGSSDEVVPNFLVRTASDSLTGCYENLRDAMGTPRPDSHLELADWCLRQKLFEEARTEVVAALKMDPNRRDARELLTRIEDAINPQPRHRQSEAAPARTADGYLEPTGRTTEGISTDATSQFVRRIQPLLVSKCGNAACHGGSSGGGFHLVNIRRSSSTGRTANLENLRAVLALIDDGEPGQTKLLSPLENAKHREAFSGTAATVQKAALTAWVQDVAVEKGLKPVTGELVATSPVWTPEKIELAAAVTSPKQRPVSGTRLAELDDERRSKDKKPTLQRVTSPPQLKKAGDDAELVERILNEERPDPFDPEEFNRLVEGRFGGKPESPK